MQIRELAIHEWDEVAELIFASTNSWYETNLNRCCFPGSDPTVCRVFPEIYEALDPGCCLVAENGGRLVGSCFYHPRESHVALGIMNAAQGSRGKGVAKELLAEVIRRAGDLPIRLVSSAMNLDSYSLYTRAGFSPVSLYQDMLFPEGIEDIAEDPHVRPVHPEDIAALVVLEKRISGINRQRDFEFFLKNEAGIWGGSVYESDGQITGFLFSVNHPGCRMLGPGIMESADVSLALIKAELSRFEGAQPIFLIPATETALTKELYALGARNCELHVAQVRGESKVPTGIVMPSFLPESG